MASKAITSAVFFLALNLLFFTLVSSTHTTKCGCQPPPPPPSKCPPPPKPHPTPTPHPPHPPPTPTPTPTPTPSTGNCPIDTLKLGVCANVLNGLLHLVIGTPTGSPACCSLIQGLADLDAAVCLCTALKVGVLGLNLNIPVDLSLLVNHCGKKVPSGFQCA